VTVSSWLISRTRPILLIKSLDEPEVAAGDPGDRIRRFVGMGGVEL
jgi:hypothetical protein